MLPASFLFIHAENLNAMYLMLCYILFILIIFNNVHVCQVMHRQQKHPGFEPQSARIFSHARSHKHKRRSLQLWLLSTTAESTGLGMEMDKDYVKCL